MPATLYFDESGKRHDSDINTVVRAAVLVNRRREACLQKCLDDFLDQHELLTELHTVHIWQCSGKYEPLRPLRQQLISSAWELFYTHVDSAVAVAISPSVMSAIANQSRIWAEAVVRDDSEFVALLRDSGASGYFPGSLDSYVDVASEALVFGSIAGAFDQLIRERRLEVNTIVDRDFVETLDGWKTVFELVNGWGSKWLAARLQPFIPFRKTSRIWSLNAGLSDADSSETPGLQLADFFAYGSRRQVEEKQGPLTGFLNHIDIRSKVSEKLGSDGFEFMYDSLVIQPPPSVEYRPFGAPRHW